MIVNKKLGNYASTLLALLTGDETEKLALHNERRASQAINKQLSSLNDRKITLQEEIENAEETVKLAEYPTTKIEENSSYCSKMVKADEILKQAKQNLEDCEASIKYFEDKRSKFGF